MSKMNQRQLLGKTKKRLLNMAVGQVPFKCIQTWYVQKDSLAIGAKDRKSIAILEKNNSVQQAKFFLRHVDDIVSAVTGDPEEALRAANLLNR